MVQRPSNAWRRALPRRSWTKTRARCPPKTARQPARRSPACFASHRLQRLHESRVEPSGPRADSCRVLRIKRPKPPADYPAKARQALRRIHADIAAGRAPAFDERIWKAHKGAFSAAQRDKCGYCEQPSLNHPGAVDHYAPKKEVQELADPGAEHILTASVPDRRTPPISRRGYWWLAYNWNNWLFVCERCNTGWKRGLFPVRENPRSLPPDRAAKETPLLLNPFGRIDPIFHLSFSRLGQIAPRNGSAYGEATIETCGLDRESLRRQRQGIAADVNRHTDRLQRALNDQDFQRAHDAVMDLLSLGAEARPHTGMVRSIVWAKLDCRWPDLERLEAKLLARTRPRVAARRRGRR